MLRNFMTLALFGALVACSGDDTGEKATSTDDGTTEDGTDNTTDEGDSCWLDDDLCVDYNGDTETWCTDLAAQYAGVLDVEYDAGPCPGDEVGTCSFAAGTGDYTDGGTAYYYAGGSNGYDAAGADAACSAAGGS